ncbi:uncharacterized protein [Littorina saxatilis]|uniref:Uncharacterized protein n=1 Tax=Littorina saxatilis TaxID=31220 RepID=A0AAN9GLW3_9CAEN
MAAKDSSNKEQELRDLLRKEHQRRHEFGGNLQCLLSHWERELLEQRTGGEVATVPELLKRLQEVDATLSPLLQQCQDLSLDVVNKREKGSSAGGERDSGYDTTPHTSEDLGARKRHATHMPRELAPPVGEAYPEVPDNAEAAERSLPADGDASQDNNHQHQDPQEHTDESSSDSETSSPTLTSRGERL